MGSLHWGVCVHHAGAGEHVMRQSSPADAFAWQLSKESFATQHIASSSNVLMNCALRQQFALCTKYQCSVAKQPPDSGLFTSLCVLLIDAFSQHQRNSAHDTAFDKL